jgi:hypothetical protein
MNPCMLMVVLSIQDVVAEHPSSTRARMGRETNMQSHVKSTLICLTAFDGCRFYKLTFQSLIGMSAFLSYNWPISRCGENGA